MDLDAFANLQRWCPLLASQGCYPMHCMEQSSFRLGCALLDLSLVALLSSVSYKKLLSEFGYAEKGYSCNTTRLSFQCRKGGMSRMCITITQDKHLL